jgi:hypothetical protein
MRHFFLGLMALIAAACVAQGAAQAADSRNPDWPCVQAKVPELSVVAMWSGPPLDDAAKVWESDPKTRDLLPRLAVRRVPIADAEKAIAEYITGSAAERESKAKLLFAGLFDRLNRERSEVINGIERLAKRQQDLAEKLRSDIAELHKAQDAQNSDPSKLAELVKQVEWSTRIFEDRSKSIRYVCEVPVLIEQRLFALGRAVQQAME